MSVLEDPDDLSVRRSTSAERAIERFGRRLPERGAWLTTTGHFAGRTGRVLRVHAGPTPGHWRIRVPTMMVAWGPGLEGTRVRLTNVRPATLEEIAAAGAWELPTGVQPITPRGRPHD